MLFHSDSGINEAAKVEEVNKKKAKFLEALKQSRPNNWYNI